MMNDKVIYQHNGLLLEEARFFYGRNEAAGVKKFGREKNHG